MRLKTLFSKLTWKIFLVDTKRGGKQASKQVDPSFLPSDRYFSAFRAVISAICCTFDLGQMFIRFLSITLFLLKFGSLIFIYQDKTCRQHVSFSFR